LSVVGQRRVRLFLLLSSTNRYNARDCGAHSGRYWWAQPTLGYNSIGGLCFGGGALLAVFMRAQVALADLERDLLFLLDRHLPHVGWCRGLPLDGHHDLAPDQGKPWLKMLVANSITIALLAAFVGSLVADKF
jgi:hypothetical protein